MVLVEAGRENLQNEANDFQTLIGLIGDFVNTNQLLSENKEGEPDKSVVNILPQTKVKTMHLINSISGEDWQFREHLFTIRDTIFSSAGMASLAGGLNSVIGTDKWIDEFIDNIETEFKDVNSDSVRNLLVGITTQRAFSRAAGKISHHKHVDELKVTQGELPKGKRDRAEVFCQEIVESIREVAERYGYPKEDFDNLGTNEVVELIFMSFFVDNQGFKDKLLQAEVNK